MLASPLTSDFAYYEERMDVRLDDCADGRVGHIRHRAHQRKLSNY